MEITTGCPSNCKYIHGNKCIATECKREAGITYIIDGNGKTIVVNDYGEDSNPPIINNGFMLITIEMK